MKHFQAPLSDYSALFGENFIGKLKNLVTSKAKPLAQIVNRLNALESSTKTKILQVKLVTAYWKKNLKSINAETMK